MLPLPRGWGWLIGLCVLHAGLWSVALQMSHPVVDAGLIAMMLGGAEVALLVPLGPCLPLAFRVPVTVLVLVLAWVLQRSTWLGLSYFHEAPLMLVVAGTIVAHFAMVNALWRAAQWHAIQTIDAVPPEADSGEASQPAEAPGQFGIAHLLLWTGLTAALLGIARAWIPWGEWQVDSISDHFDQLAGVAGASLLLALPWSLTSAILLVAGLQSTWLRTLVGLAIACLLLVPALALLQAWLVGSFGNLPDPNVLVAAHLFLALKLVPSVLLVRQFFAAQEAEDRPPETPAASPR